MVDTFSMKSNRVKITHDGKTVFDTSAKTVNLLNQMFTTSATQIIFPDLKKDSAYYFTIITDDFSHIDQEGCVSFSTVLPQEWYPGAPGVFNLPNIPIGTVPAGTDYLDIQINLNRTKDPSLYLGTMIPVACVEDEWMQPIGGSCFVEKFGNIRRMFDVVQIGTGIFIRRFQSVGNLASPPWVPGNQVYSGSGGKIMGWTYTGNPNGELLSTIQTLAVSQVLGRERGGSAACSLVDHSDFSSIYTARIQVTPGRIT